MKSMVPPVASKLPSALKVPVVMYKVPSISELPDTVVVCESGLCS